MPAYVIATIDVDDEAAAMAYAPLAAEAVIRHGGRYLVATPVPKPVEGSWDSGRLVVIEFPDLERIHTWYDSPEYRRAREIREGGVRLGLLFVEGSPPEGFQPPAE